MDNNHIKYKLALLTYSLILIFLASYFGYWIGYNKGYEDYSLKCLEYLYKAGQRNN